MVLIEGIPWEWFAKRRIMESDPLYTGPKYCDPDVPDKEQKWACVSHVWGNVTPTAVPGVTKNGKPSMLLLNKNFLKAELITELATRTDLIPVWLDIYAIDQNDEKDKAAQVSVMGEIYARCRLCITVVDDDGFVRNSLYTMENQGLTSITTTMQPIVQRIKRSSYNQRIWTLQEAALSPKSVHVVCDLCHGQRIMLQDDAVVDNLSQFTPNTSSGQFELMPIEDAVRLVTQGDIEYHSRLMETFLKIALINEKRGLQFSPVGVGEYQARYCSRLRDYAFGAAPALGLQLSTDYISATDREVFNEWMTSLTALKIICRRHWDLENSFRWKLRFDNEFEHYELVKSGYLDKFRRQIGLALASIVEHALTELDAILPGNSHKQSEQFGSLLHQLYQIHHSLPLANDQFSDGIDQDIGVVLCRSFDSLHGRKFHPIQLFSKLDITRLKRDTKSMILFTVEAFKPEYLDETHKYYKSVHAAIMYAVMYFLVMSNMDKGNDFVEYFTPLLHKLKTEWDQIEPKLPLQHESAVIDARRNSFIYGTLLMDWSREDVIRWIYSLPLNDVGTPADNLLFTTYIASTTLLRFARNPALVIQIENDEDIRTIKESILDKCAKDWEIRSQLPMAEWQTFDVLLWIHILDLQGVAKIMGQVNRMKINGQTLLDNEKGNICTLLGVTKESDAAAIRKFMSERGLIFDYSITVQKKNCVVM